MFKKLLYLNPIFFDMLTRFYFLLALVIMMGCKDQKTERIPIKFESKTYSLIGQKFDTKQVLTVEVLSKEMKRQSNQSDTLKLTLRGNIKEVCSKKGCWMTLTMESDNDLMVRFKDYGFFMPLDASGEVIVHGKAYSSETSVADLKHYAEDAGASQEEIDAITSPKMSYNFEADGVLLGY